MYKRERESVETRLKNAGFKLRDENCEDSCLFCNYYHLTDNDKIPVCELLGIKFADNLPLQDYICMKFDGGIFDSLIEAQQSEKIEKTKQKEGKIGRILGNVKLQIKNKFE